MPQKTAASKKLLALLAALALVVCALGQPVMAATPAPDPTCTCTQACTKDAPNADCPLCAADYTACAQAPPAQDAPAQNAPTQDAAPLQAPAPRAGAPMYSIEGAGVPATLQDIVNQESSGKTIDVISGGIEATPVTIPSGKSITLNLNGKSLTLDGTANAALTIEDGASLTIVNQSPSGSTDTPGHGTLTLTSASAVAGDSTLRVNPNASFTIAENANLTVHVVNTSEDINAHGAVMCEAGGIAQINGVIETKYGTAIRASGGTVLANSATSTGGSGVDAQKAAQVTLSGAVTAGTAGIGAVGGSRVTAASVSVTGAPGAAGLGVEAVGGSTVTVSGPVFSDTGDAIYAHGEGSLVKALSAESTVAEGAKAVEEARIEVTGGVTGANIGVVADKGAYVRAAFATGSQLSGVWADGGAEVHVDGEVSGGSYGIHAVNESAITAASAKGGDTGVHAAASTVTLTGSAQGGSLYGIQAQAEALVKALNATALGQGSIGAHVSAAARVELGGAATGGEAGAWVDGPGSVLKAAAVTATEADSTGLVLTDEQRRGPSTILNAEVSGAVTGVLTGVSAGSGMRAQVGSVSATSTEEDSCGVDAWDGAFVHVMGDVSCETGVIAGNGAQVRVDGSVRAAQVGALMYENATVTVYGTITSPIPAQFYTGIDAEGNAILASKIWDDSAPGAGEWQGWRVFADAATPGSVLRVHTANGPFTDPDGQQAQSTTATTQASPQTGDATGPLPYIATLLAGAALALCLTSRRKQGSRR